MNRRAVIRFAVTALFFCLFTGIIGSNAASAAPAANDPNQVRSVCVWKKNVIVVMGEIIFSGGMLQAHPGYPHVAVIRESSPQSDKLGLKQGAAYLSKKPGSYEYIENVDLKLGDDELAKKYGLAIRKNEGAFAPLPKLSR